jgi:hypothetical protein
MCFSTTGRINLVEYKTEITVVNNETMWSKYKGTYHGTVFQQDGRTMDIMLQNVLYVPYLWINLFSITKAIKNPTVKFIRYNTQTYLDNGQQPVNSHRQLKTIEAMILTATVKG